MAIPLIGAGSATVLAGESPQWQDGVAALCVVVAIATVLVPSRWGNKRG